MVVPYSTCQVVAVPFGLTLPETVAVVGVIAVTGPVEADGAVAAIAAPAPVRAPTVRTSTTKPVSCLRMSHHSYPSATEKILWNVTRR